MRIGVDMGGTKIEGVLLGAGGAILARHRRPTPQGDYAATLETVRQVVALVTHGVAEARDLPVGVGIPGALSPDSGLVMNANSVCLIGHPLDVDLARHLGRPVKLANDADCFTLSEAVDGAAAGAEIVFGVILGTGVGGGIAVGRRLLRGANAIAGEWGHNPLPWPRDDERPGPPCYCGKSGCVETFLSGPGLAQSHRRRTGLSLSAREIARRAMVGDGAAEASLQRHEERLARALAVVVNILDPHVVVLGGGLSNLARLYRNVPSLMVPFLFSDRLRTRLVPARYGDASGVRGAAWL